ncbi:tagatose-6-phosphate kinase [Streptococcus varani]|jgi:tagatose 6-phosphate kinase|uniref:Tagatose-6-phosphate kinase n=2 Tax=Bacteria TaxID=2 RepID=A0A0E4CS08_9STRE|nr:hexose kinase [Streptococcus varani]CQR24073.1 tagatose-6-phosphate kinase [Streptococcus varani]
MVLIITLNPSIDLLYFEPSFALGTHNRFNNSTIMAAGKGINCSRALSYLGENASSLSLVGGLCGNFFKKLLEVEEFESIYIPIEAETRHAITIMHDDNVHTEIVETGPKVSSDMKEKIFSEILKIIKEKKIEIISINGSVYSDDKYFYNDLIQLLRKEANPNTKILADFSRAALQNIFGQSTSFPDFIKPNMEEFGQLTGLKISKKQEVIDYLKKNPSPIPYTLVSCGEQGAIAQFNGHLYDVTAPSIQLVNPTGSGDSTVAGAIYAFKNHLSDENIIRYAIASGTANAMETGVGIARREIVEQLLEQVNIKKID